MPPKSKNRQRKHPSQKYRRESQSITLPIYDIIIVQTNESGIDIESSLYNKISHLTETSEESFIESIMKFVMELCGLGKYKQKIKWRQDIQQQIGEVLQVATENYKKKRGASKRKTTILNSQKPEYPLLSSGKSKFFSKLQKNITDFFDYFINSENEILFETKILKTIFVTLREIAQSKLRNIRASSIQLAAIIIKESCSLYKQFKQKKDNKHSKKLYTIIFQGFFEEIIKNRLKDVDFSIRQRAFNVIEDIVNKMPEVLLEGQNLEKLFLSLFSEQNSKIVESSFKTLQKLLESKHTQSGKLIPFCINLIPTIYDICVSQSSANYHALKCLMKLQRLSSSPTVLTPKQIIRLIDFQASLNSSLEDGIKSCLQIFLYSISSYKKKSELKEMQQLIIIEFTNIISSLLTTNSSNVDLKNSTLLYANSENSKLIRDLVKALLSMINTKEVWVIGFEDLLLLLFSEYYYSDKDQIDVEFREIDVYILLNFCIEYNKYTLMTQNGLSKDSSLHDKVSDEMNSYNTTVYQNSKQILNEKMIKYPHFSHLYLKLFGLLYRPLTQSSTTDFIIDRVLLLLREEKFIVMAMEDISLMYSIVKQSIQVFHTLTNSSLFKLSSIMSALGIPEIFIQTKLDPIDIIKISSLSSFYEVQEFHDMNFLKICFSSYTESRESMHTAQTKLQLLTFFSNIHQQLFNSFFSSPTQNSLNNFINFRNSLTDLITLLMLNSTDQNTLVKLGGFGIICQILKLSGHDKMSKNQFSPVYCQFNERQLQSILEYIENIFSIQKEGAGQLAKDNEIGFSFLLQSNTQNSLTEMLNNVTLESTELKQKVLSELFTTFQANIIFFHQCNSLVSKFIIIYYIITNYSLRNQVTINLLEQTSLHSSLKFPTLVFLQENINTMIQDLIKREIKEQNKNRFVFWRFFKELYQYIEVILVKQPSSMMKEAISSDESEDEKQENVSQNIDEKIMLMIIDYYLKFKKNHSKSSKILNDKMMLYLADSIDKIATTYLQFTSENSIDKKDDEEERLKKKVQILHKIIYKVYRRYPKEVLHRFSIFLNNKLRPIIMKNSKEEIEVQNQQQTSPHRNRQLQSAVMNLQQFLDKISKIQKKPTEKKKKGQSSSSDQGERQREGESQNEESEERMSQDQFEEGNRRVTRSKSKRKTKRVKG